MNKKYLSQTEEKNSTELTSLKSKYDNFNKQYGFRKINPVYIYLSAGILSIIWAGIIGYYAKNSIYNWSSFFKMLPHEFGGFLAGTIMPIGFIWMVAMYIDRNINSNYEHKVIYPFLQSIIDPHGDTSVITKVITKKIETETNELKKTIDKFIDYSEKLAIIHNSITNEVKETIKAIKEHETSIKSITNELNNSTDSIDSKTKNMLSDIEKHIALLTDTTDSAEKKTNNITENLLSETDKLEKTITKTAEIVETISKTIDTNSDNMNNSTTDAIRRIKEVESTFDTINDRILSSSEIAETRANQMLNTVSTKSSEFVEKANISAERINAVMNNITNSVDKIEHITNENEATSKQTLAIITEQSNNMIENLQKQASRFENNSNSILSIVGQVENKFTNIDKSIGLISENIISHFKDIAQEINNQKESLFTTSTEVAENINNVSEKILTEKNNFINSISDIKDIAQNTTSEMKLSSGEIISTSDTIKNAAKEINDLMTNSSHNLSNQANLTLKVASDIKDTLRNEIGELEEVANNVATQSRLGEMSIKSQGKKLSEVTEDLMVKIDSMNGKISATINNILNLSGQIDNKLNNINDTILQKSSQAAKIINESIERSTNSTDTFRNVASVFLENSMHTNAEISKLISELRQETLALDNASKSTKELVGNISSELFRASQSLPELSSNISAIDTNLQNTNLSIENSISTTNKKTKEIIENLENIEKQFSKFVGEKSSELEYISNASTQAITKVANYTNKLSEEAQKSLSEFKLQYEAVEALSKKMPNIQGVKNTSVSTENFLNEAGFIIEKLNSVSIDISQILSPDVSQDLWNKYNAGHKNVFSRYLAKMLDKKQVTALQNLIAKDTNLGNHIKSFVSEFNNIIIKAQTTDKSEILVATLTSTDIGKIYMILREVVA